MDFHTLTRRQLQTLCKKNKIPANITNVAMADALSALPTVEGIEELSPAKSLADGGASICRTTTTSRRTRSVKDDSDENFQPSRTRTTRRSSRKDVVHQTRQTPAKIDTLDFTGIDEEEEGAEIGGNGKQKCNLDLNTPAPVVVPAGRQRGLNLKGGETTLTRAQGTRRSTRLAVKNSQRNDDTYSVPKKMDFEEILQGADCSDHSGVDSVAESLGRIDLNGKSEEGLEKGNDASGHLLIVESDCPAKKQESEVAVDDDDGNHGSEIVEPKIPVDAVADGAGKDIHNDVPQDVNATKEKTFENGEELDTNIRIAAQDNKTDSGAFSVEIGIDLNMSKEVVESKQESHIEVDISQTETKNDVLEDETEKDDVDEKEVQFSGFAAESVDEEEKSANLEEVDPSRIDTAAVKSAEYGDSEINSKTEKQEQDVGITDPAVEPVVEIEMGISSAVEEAVEDNLAEKLNAMELDSGVDPSSNSEEEWIKDSMGNNAVTVSVSDSIPLLEQSDGVLEMENKPEEEDLNNTSMDLDFERYSTKQQDVIAAAVVDSTENLSVELGFEGYSTKPQDVVAAAAVDSNETQDAIDVTAIDSIENQSNLEGVSSVTQSSAPAINYLSPLKASVHPSPRKIPLLQKSASKTPTSAKRMMIKSSDDKENNIIDNSGKKLTVITSAAKEKNEKNIFFKESQKPWDEASLRKLKKELKAKLEANNNNKAASSRPALQALPENRQVAES